ncbi:MAG: CZB domain-containing protein [Magnetococcales bacterium]|nr:CZB domain-containing protein [Magnetococcales bacterium]
MPENPFPSDSPYLVVTVDGGQYGISHEEVVSVSDLPAHTFLPQYPPEVRGVIPFRDGCLPLLDLRLCFGTRSRLLETEELITTMAQRRQDHVNWLNKLKGEVESGAAITVQTDPTKCAFGKWYYGQFRTDNKYLSAYMARFDQPHRRIHQVAVEAMNLLDKGQDLQAKQLVQEAEKGILAGLLTLFDGIGELVRKYLLEYSVVMQHRGQLFAVAVDDINFFSVLEEIKYPLPSQMGRSELVGALGRYRSPTDESMRDVLLVDVARLLNQNALPSGDRPDS